MRGGYGCSPGSAEEAITSIRKLPPSSRKPYVLSHCGPVTSLHPQRLTQPPRTPIARRKPQVPSPPSVSPSRDLGIHRENIRYMLWSTSKRAKCIESLGFNAKIGHNPVENTVMPPHEFGIFQDFSVDYPPFPGIVTIGTEFPVKLLAETPRLDRCVGRCALGEITKSGSCRRESIVERGCAHGVAWMRDKSDIYSTVVVLQSSFTPRG